MADSSLKKEIIEDSTPNAVYYSGDDGRVMGDGEDEALWEGAKRLDSGDIVSVTVDLEKGEIEWKVNEISQFKYLMPKLKEGNIKWVPLLWMYNTGDCVEWL